MLRFIFIIACLPLLGLAAEKSALMTKFNINIVEPKHETTWFLGNFYRVVVKIQPVLTKQDLAKLWINDKVVKTVAGTSKTEIIIFTDLDPLTLLQLGENRLKVQVEASVSDTLILYRRLPRRAVNKPCLK